MRIKLESDVRKNRSIKPKIRWKAKKLPDAWQGQHQVLEVQQALNVSCLRCGKSAPWFLRNGKPPGMGAFLLPFFDKIPPIILVYEKLGEKRPLPPVVGAVPLFHKKGRFLRKTTRTVGFPAPLPHQAGIFLRK